MGKTATELEWRAILARRSGLPPFNPGTDTGTSFTDSHTDITDTGTDVTGTDTDVREVCPAKLNEFSEKLWRLLTPPPTHTFLGKYTFWGEISD